MAITYTRNADVAHQVLYWKAKEHYDDWAQENEKKRRPSETFSERIERLLRNKSKAFNIPHPEALAEAEQACNNAIDKAFPDAGDAYQRAKDGE